MKTKHILNSELASAVASMGHTDRMIVADAAYPIPDETTRIDLALSKDVPTIYQVLNAINSEFIAERVLYSDGAEENNPKHGQRIQEMYADTGAEIATVSQDEIMNMRHEVKVVVRTGHFLPWGNVVLQSGTDPTQWFDQEDVTMPPDQAERYEQMQE